MQEKAIKIQEALLWAIDALSQTTESAAVRLEAEILLAFVLNRDRVYLYTWPEKTLTPSELTSFQTYIERRKAGEPIAYIVEEKEFWSLPLKVSPAVLIPRPETETIVEEILKHLPLNDPNIRLLELGTGSGAIALALAKENPLWQIIATDVSQSALQVAQHNAKILAINQIQWLRGDWFNALSHLQANEKKFHAIVSNPPYIETCDPHLAEDLRYEPKNALVAEKKGYSALEEIINEAPNYLELNGWIFLEHGATQAMGVCKLLESTGFSHILTIKDLAGVNRVTLAQWKKI